MPFKTKRACRVCGRAASGSYCDEHSRGNPAQAADRERLVARNQTCQRLYNSRTWRDRSRPHIIRRDPLCKIGLICGGTAPSTEADHVIPAVIYIEQHAGDASYFFDDTNLQGACKPCHAHKTRLEQRDGGSIL